MAKIDPQVLRDWNNGETMFEADYELERQILFTAINDNYDRLIKKFEVVDAAGVLKTTQNLDTAINYLKFKEDSTIALTLDATTATLHIAVIDGSITTQKLKDLGVTTSKIADGNVTTVKIADLNVTRDKLADNVVNLQKLDLSDIDTRYYTKIQLDATTRDHPGTWRGLTPSQASEAVNGGRIDFMETAKKEQSTLNNGENIINSVSKWKSSINVLSTVGKTSIVDGSGIHGVMNPTIESNGKRMVIPTILHGINGVQDEVFVDVDGKLKKRSNFKELILDGSLPWTHNTNLTGFKQVMLNSSGLFPGVDTADKFTVSKYDGTILQDGIDAFDRSVADEAQIHSSNKQLYITISDNDSGWGSEYIPTNDEVKAYFYGWRMRTEGSTAPYTGTGTKYWGTVQSGGTYDVTNVLPTTFVHGKHGYTPYKIVHQLSAPSVEEINTYGQVVLNEGSNEVSVKQGIIVRERANFVYGSQDTVYYLNYVTSLPASKLKHKVSRFIKVYKGDSEENHFVIMNSAGAYGNQLGYIDDVYFDPNAEYYVDYEILPELTALSESINVEYAVSLKSSIDEHTEKIGEHGSQLHALLGILGSNGGTLVERGSNANGEYFRFANGIAVCIANQLNVNATANVNLDTPWYYPSALSETPLYVGLTIFSVSGTNDYSVNRMVVSSFGSNMLNVGFKATVTQQYRLKILLIGRWK